MIESYIALGDGLSLDPFIAQAATTPGAGSLLASELARNHSCGKYKNFARERSRMNTIWLNALPSILTTRGQVVVTITTGLEDLIDMGLEFQHVGQVNTAVHDAIGGYRRLVRTLRRLLPNALVVGTTVPDPTSGEGFFPIFRTPFPSFGAILFNDLLREYASEADGFVVADVFSHLLNPIAWAAAQNVQLSAFGCRVIATTWLGEIAKAGFVELDKAAVA